MKPVQRVSITDSVVSSIKELILSGKYQEGDKLPTEQCFCETLGVSRTTVREALRVLRTLGYVNIFVGKGAFVARVTEINDMESSQVNEGDYKFMDFMEVRLAIEPVAAKLATEHGTLEQIVELEELNASFCDAVQKRDFIKMMLVDDHFHRQIFLMGRNRLLININNDISKVYLKYRKESFTDDKIYKNAVPPHQKIFLCIKERNVDGAADAMREHMEMAIRDMNAMHNPK